MGNRLVWKVKRNSIAFWLSIESPELCVHYSTTTTTWKLEEEGGGGDLLSITSNSPDRSWDKKGENGVSFFFFFLPCWLTAHRRVCYSLRRETSALELESARYGRLNELYRAGVTITRACGHGSRLQSQQEKTVGAKEYFSCISFLFPPSGTCREKQNGRVCVCFGRYT